MADVIRVIEQVGRFGSGAIADDVTAPSRAGYRPQAWEAGGGFGRYPLCLKRGLSYGYHGTIKKDGIETNKMAGL
jgi:hypothetical protein